MQLKILYFGMIAEITKCSHEILAVETKCNSNQLETVLKKKYQQLQSISFKLVINQNIATKTIFLHPDHEVALLPPFAGG